MNRVYRIEDKYGGVYFVYGEWMDNKLYGTYITVRTGEVYLEPHQRAISNQKWMMNREGYIVDEMPEGHTLEDYL